MKWAKLNCFSELFCGLELGRFAWEDSKRLTPVLAVERMHFTIHTFRKTWLKTISSIVLRQLRNCFLNYLKTLEEKCFQLNFPKGMAKRIFSVSTLPKHRLIASNLLNCNAQHHRFRKNSLIWPTSFTQHLKLNQEEKSLSPRTSITFKTPRPNPFVPSSQTLNSFIAFLVTNTRKKTITLAKVPQRLVGDVPYMRTDTIIKAWLLSY